MLLRNNKWRFLFIALVLILGGIVYFIFDPSVSGNFFPQCPFRLLTGYDCPGCGSQRTLHALLHGDLHKAFALNPFLVLSLPIVALLIFARWQRFRFPRLYHYTTHRYFIFSFVIATLCWWVGRNL